MKLLTCDADSQTILARSGRSPHLGRTHRLVPDWLRVIIFDRDGSCRVPGCGRTLGLDVHHLRHWSDGGETNSDNLVTLCRRHHTLHHKGLLGISGTPEQLPGPGMPDGLTFTNHCGRRLEHPPPEPAPPPRDHPDPPVYQPPTGERLQTWAVHFNPNEPPDRRV